MTYMTRLINIFKGDNIERRGYRLCFRSYISVNMCRMFKPCIHGCSFNFSALHLCTAVLAMSEMSVRPSDKRVNCDKTKLEPK